MSGSAEEVNMSEAAGGGNSRVLGGRYAIGEFIGQGGMATVYRGTDIKLGRQVAIKVMKSELSGDEQFRARFRQEAQSASRMAHPTIVRVFDAGDDLIQTADGAKRLPFIVMEYVEGTNLRQFIEENELSQTEAARIVESVLTALEYSHRAGIVHRDIKPANIMITKSGQVKVMDFGIARAVSETSSTLQQTTAILGTAAYFSPEQAKGESVDARTDLYSTAVMLYELLARDVPFRGDTAVAVAYQHVSERPTAPSTRNPDVPPELDRVVLYGLGKDRARRFQTAAEFRDALNLAASGTMPDLPNHDTQNTVLFSSGEEVSESDLAIRQLAEGGGSRTQSRPPVMWTWAAILTIAAIVIAVVFWLVNLVPNEISPSTVRDIPELTDVSRSEAVDMLLGLDLQVKQIDQPDESVANDHVISSDPVAGTAVNVGDEVTLYISTGPEQALVPAFSGKSQEAYTEALTGLGLTVGQVTTQDDAVAPAGRVLGVSPDIGSKIDPGGAVNITVASGKVDIPNVINQSLDTARNMLSGLGLDLTIDGQMSASTGCVYNEQLLITGQTLVGSNPQGSQLTVTYCSG
ncbi:Stk1 family PASTA domain-containing Ser/Thr kinase [Leucobacter komagatae]|uniref:Stk1 family PASTA domain-containing Ser/Thr kinase n=1 Tax=Leucobacter komagatae TaxID=55969 RepID=UPI0012ED60DE|nr:Stk1 family PASTA domain-containing Ser/Thr kinase [Leucobacter komagatae]